MAMHFEKVFKWAKLVDNKNHQIILTLSSDELNYQTNQFDSESDALRAAAESKLTKLVLLTIYMKVWRED